MDANFYLKFGWEVTKTFLPAYTAWWLAKRSAEKSSEANRLEMREQLRISKMNSFEVQNKAYRLQFSIEQLEKYVIASETALDCWNQTMFGFEFAYNKEKDFASAVQARLSMEKYMDSYNKLLHRMGFLESVILAANPNAYAMCQEKERIMNDAANRLAPLMHEINWKTDHIVSMHIVQGKKFEQFIFDLADQVDKQRDTMNDYADKLLAFRDFLLEQVDIVFKKLDR